MATTDTQLMSLLNNPCSCDDHLPHDIFSQHLSLFVAHILYVPSDLPATPLLLQLSSMLLFYGNIFTVQ